VKVLMAEDLEWKDFGVFLQKGKGKSDPYTILSVGSKNVKSSVVQNNVNPIWENFVADFPVEFGQELLVQLFDEDILDDDTLGWDTIPIGPVIDRGCIKSMWVDLEGVKSGRVLLSLTWLPTSEDEKGIEIIKTNGLPKCILEVFIDSCKGLVEKKY
jgi:Ca2+-dependent lipid-binding protein